MCLKSVVWYLICVKLSMLFISGVSQLLLVEHSLHLQYQSLLPISIRLVISPQTKTVGR
ncbi:hypothetical protein PAHAL_7G230700 [Panicum hallii]|uniref:Uncharacterized protein n=1 Tax=Panicum hallii TaxID=206008 RepID=A0A2T8ID99_9POAL|nr:hypothetical protein PAHAL_7G230700 [Panicum hallii]